MTNEHMTSFTHSCEDVLLRRALSDVENGFYIDVGAFDPEMDSVTKAFYDRGWRGVNLEPNPAYLKRLVELRPRDLNLATAASEAAGTFVFYVVEETGLSTLICEQALESAGGIHALRTIEVEAETLAVLWDRWVPAMQPVHFLKIDVEGAEDRVIAGADWKRHRPWILVIEATLPNTSIPSHGGWEPILLGAGYLFAYFDGVNRYYVAQEHSDRLVAFNRPVNPMIDGFKPFLAELIERNMQREVDMLRIEQGKLIPRVEEAEGALDEARRVQGELQGQIDSRTRTISRLEDENRISQELSQAVEREQQMVAALASSVARLEAENRISQELSQAVEREQQIVAALVPSIARLEAEMRILTQMTADLHPRSLSERILFYFNGRPKRLLRRVLFHSSGKPRGIFKPLIQRLRPPVRGPEPTPEPTPEPAQVPVLAPVGQISARARLLAGDLEQRMLGES